VSFDDASGRASVTGVGARVSGLTVAFVVTALFAIYLAGIFACIVWYAPLWLTLAFSVLPTILVARRVRRSSLAAAALFGTFSAGIAGIWFQSTIERLPLGGVGYIQHGNLHIVKYEAANQLVWGTRSNNLLGISHSRSPAIDKNGDRVMVDWRTIPLGIILVTTLLIAGLCFAVWLAESLVALNRRIVRTRAGHCATCGYDLRGSVVFGRCPECGRVIGD
jgi:hypothetical protein